MNILKHFSDKDLIYNKYHNQLGIREQHDGCELLFAPSIPADRAKSYFMKENR